MDLTSFINMKIIKINTDHYVVVDDSEIKEGDWLLDITDNTIWDCHKDMPNSLFPECKKITHSTQPLEYDEDNTYTYDKVKYIPLSYIKELIGEVDVEKKAREEGGYDVFRDRIIYSHGYNQALEDNKEKKYTEEDIVKAIEMAREGIRVTRISEWETEKEFDYNDYQIIQSLQPKTEWEVEIVDGKLKLV